jgi:transcription antitermination factor NusG
MQKSSVKQKRQSSHLDINKSKWFAVYTKYKSEKFVQQRLDNKGIEAYVPLLHYTRRYSKKVKQVQIPLISCYVFVKIKQPDYVRVLETEHVVFFLKMNGELISIPEKEMELMKWVVGEKAVVEVVEGGFVKGVEVEVVSGNLTGLKGKILQQKNKKFFSVELKSMGYNLVVDVAQELLQRIHPLVKK